MQIQFNTQSARLLLMLFLNLMLLIIVGVLYALANMNSILFVAPMAAIVTTGIANRDPKLGVVEAGLYSLNGVLIGQIILVAIIQSIKFAWINL